MRDPEEYLIEVGQCTQKALDFISAAPQFNFPNSVEPEWSRGLHRASSVIDLVDCLPRMTHKPEVCCQRA
jgi:hypothetical protein